MTGIITLSIELELAWGMHDKDEYSHLSTSRNPETTALERLLTVAEEFRIPITFNAVGHLLESSCSGSHESPHPMSWWDADPGTDVNTNPQFYAPDLIEKIYSQQVTHEIATHTYSHLLANESTNAQLDYELTAVDNVHAAFGIPSPTSIIMPRHEEPNYSVLRSHGIDTIRRPISGYTPSFSNRLSKLGWLFSRSHPRSTLQMNDGLLETTVTPHPSLSSPLLSVGQKDPHPVIDAFPKSLRQSVHRRYVVNAIKRAAKTDTHVHLWTHLYNIANKEQWVPIKEGLRYLAERRDEGNLKIKVMADLQDVY